MRDYNEVIKSQDIVDNHYKIVRELVKKQLGDTTVELDNLIKQVDEELKGKEVSKIPLNVLNNYIADISVQLYYIQSKTESLGIKYDISEVEYKQTYFHYFAEVKGTIEDKRGYAEMHAVYEKIVRNANERSYKIVKGKMERALEVINSLKKVVSSRMVENDITRTATEGEFKPNRHKQEF